jgi:hypothetical protein
MSPFAGVRTHAGPSGCVTQACVSGALTLHGPQGHERRAATLRGWAMPTDTCAQALKQTRRPASARRRRQDGSGPSRARSRAGGRPLQVGSRTECALLALAGGLGADYAAARGAGRLLAVAPFSSDRKRMSTLVAAAEPRRAHWDLISSETPEPAPVHCARRHAPRVCCAKGACTVLVICIAGPTSRTVHGPGCPRRAGHSK